MQAQDEQSPGETEFQRGRDALFRGRYDEAIEALQAAVAADKAGTNMSYRLHLARAYRYAKRPQESEQLLTEILKEIEDAIRSQLLATPTKAEDEASTSEEVTPG